METRYDFGPNTGKPIVYVRAVNVADLPEAVRSEVGDLKRIYAVCSSEGEQLALVRDRALAFVLARQNDFSPVTVH